jgi:nitrogen fixation NifU-like protein
MMFMLKIQNDIIADVRWKTYGCASAIASTSMLSETIKGMNIRDAYHIKPADIASRLGGLPENKIHCSVLGDKALRAAIDVYLEQHGRAGEFKGEDAQIICKCLNITDKDIEEAVRQGAHDWHSLQEATKIGTVCGSCKTKAEELLHDQGFAQVRVRYHAGIARIEAVPGDMEKLLSIRGYIAKNLKNAGFHYVALDLDGYRPGSMDEVLEGRAP